uniref:LIM zinc-binding domain-containing protein n=1 Tax=Poecilia mexicana TaxID=48701 RepID=A0A3B3WLE5_9TELE
MVGYCPICGKPVYFGEKKRSLGRDYHPLCLKCQKCNRQLTAGQHAEAAGEGCLHRNTHVVFIAQNQTEAQPVNTDI